MDKICSIKIDRNVQIVAGVLAGIAASGFVITKLRARIQLSNARKKWEEAGENVVVLHMFPRPKNVTSLSPFPVKLETFLRMSNIKYVPDFDFPMSSKGKSPWITINGVDVADSQLALEYLGRHFNINLNSHLSPEEVSISRAMRALLEDHLYFCCVVEKWVIGRGQCVLDQTHVTGGKLGWFLRSIILEKYAKILTTQAYMQGIGRHSIEDVRSMMKQDVECLANFLGEKPYLMGAKPSEVDCIFFAFMVIAKYASITAENVLVNYPNLSQYVERMKAEFYPDWNDILTNKK